MSNNASDSVNTASFVPLLQECEHPTIPVSTSLRPETPPSLLGCSVQPNQEICKSVNSGLELEEDDRLALLAVLNDQCGSNEQNDVGIIDRNTSQSFGRQHHVVTSSESDETHAAKLARLRAMATKRRNRHRQRVKADLQGLRLQDTELSAKLEILKRSRAAAASGVAQLKWQALASKELIARLHAECQQQRLRRDIERRTFAMQKLQDMFDVKHFFAAPKSDNISTEWMSDDIKRYGDFMTDVIPAYARTDEVFNTSNLAGYVSNQSYFHPIWKQDVHRGEEFFESTCTFAIPSHYSKASVAMFNAMHQVLHDDPRVCILETVDDRSNTLAAKSGVVFDYEQEQVISFSMISVMYRFIEHGRTVLVWRCLIEGEGEFTGVYLDETGWCMLSPTTSSSIDMTNVQICIRSVPTPMNPNQEEKSFEEVETFAKAVVRSSQQDSLKLAYLMEQLLLDQAADQ